MVLSSGSSPSRAHHPSAGTPGRMVWMLALLLPLTVCAFLPPIPSSTGSARTAPSQYHLHSHRRWSSLSSDQHHRRHRHHPPAIGTTSTALFSSPDPSAAAAATAIEQVAAGGGDLSAAIAVASDPPSFLPDDPSFFHRLLAVVLGTAFTWFAHNHYGYNRVLSSASFTLLASLVAPGLGQAAMCGTFSGFSTALIIPSLSMVLALGLVTFAVFETVIHQRDAARGLGGRLGLMAFISVNLTLILRQLTMVVHQHGRSLFRVSGKEIKALVSLPFVVGRGVAALSTQAVVSTLAYTALGAAATIWLRESWSEIKDPVRGAAYIGVAGGMLLHPTMGDLATVALYGGAFIGMSSPSRLERQAPWNTPPLHKARSMVSFALAGLLAGGVSVATNHLFVGGWGGKLGACSFLGAVSFRLLLNLIDRLTPRRK